MTAGKVVTHEGWASEPATQKGRWIALYVLCVGMLMIVLDATVVNVALPSIQDDLGFSQSSLAWVVNAYLIAFGGLLLLAGGFGDLICRKSVPGRSRRVHGGLAPVRCRAEPGAAGRGPVPPGRRGRDDLGGDPWHDRHHVPRAARAGESHRRVQLRRLGWRLHGTARWRRAHPGHQLALDLLVNMPIGIATAVLALRLLDWDKGMGFGGGRHPGAVLITAP